MTNIYHAEHQIQSVSSFQDLVSTPFNGAINTICWTRDLIGDFSEIVNQISLDGNIVELGLEELQGLELSKEGQLARDILLHDLKVLKAQGASPILNLIKSYERDDSFPFFPTDVYSFHVDRSPVAVDTFLCTYYGEASEILPNSEARQKVLIAEIRDELKKLYDGPVEDFESFLSEQFFNLHYQASAEARPIKLGLGHICKLAIDHPEIKVAPCIHRAPVEKDGLVRLMLIC